MPDQPMHPAHPLPHPDLGGYVLGTLEPDEAREFRAHLGECEACRVEADELAEMPRLLALAAPPLTGHSPDVEEEGHTELRRRITARRRWRRVYAIASAAALVAVVTGAAMWLARHPSPSAFEVALAPPAATSGADVAAGPAGLATLRPNRTGVHIQLELEGLAPEAGAHYECWYVSPHDTAGAPDRVSAGTFTAPSEDRFTVEMSTAADPATFSAIVVTIERDGGDPAPGQPVLVSEDWNG